MKHAPPRADGRYAYVADGRVFFADSLEDARRIDHGAYRATVDDVERYMLAPWWDDLSDLVAANERIEQARRDRDTLICDYYRRGVSTSRMAAALGFTAQGVYKVLDANGIERGKNNGR